MNRWLLYFLLFNFPMSAWGCNKNAEEMEPRPFDSIPLVTPVKPIIREASGIADSRKNKGFLWVQEDSGNEAQLYLLGHDGNVAKTIPLPGIANRDWEELQLVDGQLYLAEIGDNLRRHAEYRFYIFEEPLASTVEIKNVQTIRFQYEDGARDAEAFLVDGATRDIYLFTKSDDPAKIYKIAFPYSTTSVNIAKEVGQLTYKGVVAAALSPDGKEAIVKTYAGLQHYTRKGTESFLQMFQKPFTALPYRAEIQGEAVAFSIHGDGYFTLSEKGIFNNQNLYYYKRK